MSVVGQKHRGLLVYMSTRHVKSPAASFSFFLTFLLFDRAAGFLPPRPRIVAGRRAQGVSRLAAFRRPPSGLGLYTTEHDGRT